VYRSHIHIYTACISGRHTDRLRHPWVLGTKHFLYPGLTQHDIFKLTFHYVYLYKYIEYRYNATGYIPHQRYDRIIMLTFI